MIKFIEGVFYDDNGIYLFLVAGGRDKGEGQ